MPDQFYLELPGGQFIAEAAGADVVLFYSGRGGFRLDADQALTLVEWLDGRESPLEAPAHAPDAPVAPAPVAAEPAAPALTVVDPGGILAPVAPAVEPGVAAQDAAGGRVTVQLTPEQVVRLQALLSPVTEIKPEG